MESSFAKWFISNLFRKINLIISLSICFLFLIFLYGNGNAVERKKKILVVHSYHQGLEWTDNISNGIRSIFDPLHRLYEIHYEYLDTKRNTDKTYLEKVSRFVTQKNRQIKYEAIIVSDNSALAQLNTGALAFKGDPPIIFCGINNYSKSLTENLTQVTGIVESTDVRGTLDLIIKLHPDQEHLLVVLDRTTTGNAIREEFARIEHDYVGLLNFDFLRDFALDEIPDILARRRHYDIIYILTFNRDKNGDFVSYTEGIDIFSRNSKLPIYGSWDFYLGKGIVGGKITSGHLQGAQAAKTTLDVLRGRDINSIEVQEESPTQYIFDFLTMNRFGIYKSQLPQGSRIINLPPTTFEKYKTLLIVITGVAISITLFILWKYHRQRLLLKKKKVLTDELEERVRERTQELEQANSKLKQISQIDGLTQLHNRACFDETLLKELKRAQRSSSPLSLILCDIDHFKNYNDTYGHLAGDDCIKTVAAAIQGRCARDSDCVARYGGEEFGIILPGTDAAHAKNLAELIRERIKTTKIPHASSDTSPIVSISIGVSTIIPQPSTTPSDLISMADKALYASKDAGRDRTTLFSDRL